MVVNRGFSFKHRVNEYKLVGIKSKESNVDEPYILACGNPTEKVIYSQNSYEEGSVAYEFSAVDYNSLDEILAFSNKYGLLYEEEYKPETAYEKYLRENHKERDSSLEALLSLYPQPEIVTYTCLGLHKFRAEAKMMRLLISLKAAIDSDNVPEMIQSIVLIFLSRPANFEMISPAEEVAVKLKSESERLRYFLHSYFALQEWRSYDDGFSAYAHQPIPKLVDGFIKEIKTFYRMNKGGSSNRIMEEMFGPYQQYTDINSKSWKIYLCLISDALKIAPITQDTYGVRTRFDEGFDIEVFNGINIKTERIVNIAKRCLSDFMNAHLDNIRPEVRIEDGELTADWNVPTLLQAMYLELQVAFAPNVQVKKCANPTCNYFFDVGVGNTNKIYCSQRCALLMAKRKQRLREKNKKMSEK